MRSRVTFIAVLICWIVIAHASGLFAEPGIKGIIRQTRGLQPTHSAHVPLSLSAELVGYDLVALPEGQSKEPSRILNRTSTSELSWNRVTQGQAYRLFYYCRCLEPVKQMQYEFNIALGAMNIARAQFQLSNTRIGGVHKFSVDIRIPLVSPVGSMPLNIIPDVKGNAVEVGLFTIDRRFIPQRRAPGGKFEPVAGNLIQNGSFEEGTSAWQSYDPFPPGVSVSIDREVVYDGSASLRLDFSGATDPDVWRTFYQPVEVKPNTAYTLSYYMKTEHLNTPCGAKLEVVDRDHMQNFIVGPEYLTGTHDWKKMTSRFFTPDFTNIILIRVRRYACGITSGSVWFDRIVLTEG